MKSKMKPIEIDPTKPISGEKLKEIYITILVQLAESFCQDRPGFSFKIDLENYKVVILENGEFYRDIIIQSTEMKLAETPDTEH